MRMPAGPALAIVCGVRPVSTILDRFRRAAAVPAGVADDLTRELAPVFAALDSIESECERVLAEATEAAERRLAAVRAENAVVSARSREHAEAVRTETEAERRRVREQEAHALRAEAEAEAEAIRERGEGAIPELVAAVVACVRAEAA
jgi:vacuolar-type H+-ATPase subunit H